LDHSIPNGCEITVEILSLTQIRTLRTYTWTRWR